MDGDKVKCLHPVYLAGGTIPVPCGKCINCCTNYSQEWSLRIIHEASLHEENCFITLTYDDEKLGYPAVDLDKRHIQLFLKRLRKRIKVPIRFYQCGEYGGKTNRPHYHMIIFGWQPDDLVYLKTTKKGQELYKSDFLADVWSYGFVGVGALTMKTAPYCTKYMQKLDKREHNVKPFSTMSLKPGIGFGVITPYDLARKDYVIEGHHYPVPKAYINYLSRFPQYEQAVEIVKDRKAEQAGFKRSDYLDYNDYIKRLAEESQIMENLEKPRTFAEIRKIVEKNCI